MTHLAQMRIGSLEIVTALAAVAARRVAPASRDPRPRADRSRRSRPCCAIFELGRERLVSKVCAR